jgi:hypothetical protein
MKKFVIGTLTSLCLTGPAYADQFPIKTYDCLINRVEDTNGYNIRMDVKDITLSLKFSDNKYSKIRNMRIVYNLNDGNQIHRAEEYPRAHIGTADPESKDVYWEGDNVKDPSLHMKGEVILVQEDLNETLQRLFYIETLTNRNTLVFKVTSVCTPSEG